MSKKTTRYARSRGLLRLPPADRSLATQSLKSDGLRTNNLRNTPFTEEELGILLREPRQAQQAMRTGQGTYNDLVSLSSALHKGVAIEDARVIVRGFAPLYAAANEALRAIEARATRTGRWVPTALYASEMLAIDDLLFAYQYALRVCTYTEFYARQAVAVARTASAGLPVLTTGDVAQYPAAEAVTGTTA